MSIIKNPELKGILVLVLIMAVIGFAMMAMSGKLEQWFGITWFSGPRALDKIVFVSDRDGTPDIYVMSTDGTGQTRLTSNASPQSLPAVSTSGNRIMFVSNAGGSSRVVSIGANGGEPVQVTTASGPKSEPAFSPDGKKMSFISGGRVYVADLNGEGLDAVLPTDKEVRAALGSALERGSLPPYPIHAWGPDGSSMAGVTTVNENCDVLVYLPKLADEPLRVPFVLNGEPGRISYISWAAGKPVLAITGTIGKQGMVALFDAESRQAMFMPTPKGYQFGSPALSPDGGALVMCAKLGAKSALVRIDLSSGQSAAIAQGEFEGSAFSPKGDKILATQIGADGKRDIVTIDPSSGQVTKLTSDGHSYNAVWTPISEK